MNPVQMEMPKIFLYGCANNIQTSMGNKMQHGWCNTPGGLAHGMGRSLHHASFPNGLDMSGRLNSWTQSLMNLIFLPNQKLPVPGVVSHRQKLKLVLVLCKYHIGSWHFQCPELQKHKPRSWSPLAGGQGVHGGGAQGQEEMQQK